MLFEKFNYDFNSTLSKLKICQTIIISDIMSHIAQLYLFSCIFLMISYNFRENFQPLLTNTHRFQTFSFPLQSPSLLSPPPPTIRDGREDEVMFLLIM